MLAACQQNFGRRPEVFAILPLIYYKNTSALLFISTHFFSVVVVYLLSTTPLAIPASPLPFVITFRHMCQSYPPNQNIIMLYDVVVVVADVI